MGKAKITLPPEEEKKKLLSILPDMLDKTLSTLQEIQTEIDSIKDGLSPELREQVSVPFENLRAIFVDFKEDMVEETPLEILRDIHGYILEFANKLTKVLEEKDRDYRIVTDPQTGERRVLEFKTQKPSGGGAFRTLKELSKIPTSSRVDIPKDLIETQTSSVGNTLEYITDPDKKEKIRKMQEDGRLLAGTLEGLSGGGAYLKSFTIALALTLNEQSKYFNTEEDNTGVPVSIIPELFKERVVVQDNLFPIIVKGNGDNRGTIEKRKSPTIIVAYDALARKMKGEGKVPGGQDIKFIRDYIKDLSGKEYLLDGGGGAILGVPFLTKTLTIYREDNGKEVGCLLSLSPQFSKSLRGYTAVRGDILQKIGGGRQKDITMNLLTLLLYVRGVNKDNIWKKKKEDLLSQIATSNRYQRQKGERERDFREAIQKVKDSGLIINYREESGGISVFSFNPDYPRKDSPEVQIEGGVS